MKQHGGRRHYTVHLTGEGTLLPRFEQVLDHLPGGVIVGDERGATLTFDVRALDDDEAVEWAWLRTQGIVKVDEKVILTVALADDDEPAKPWWKRLIGA